MMVLVLVQPMRVTEVEKLENSPRLRFRKFELGFKLSLNITNLARSLTLIETS